MVLYFSTQILQNTVEFQWNHNKVHDRYTILGLEPVAHGLGAPNSGNRGSFLESRDNLIVLLILLIIMITLN